MSGLGRFVHREMDALGGDNVAGGALEGWTSVGGPMYGAGEAASAGGAVDGGGVDAPSLNPPQPPRREVLSVLERDA